MFRKEERMKVPEPVEPFIERSEHYHPEESGKRKNPDLGPIIEAHKPTKRFPEMPGKGGMERYEEQYHHFEPEKIEADDQELLDLIAFDLDTAGKITKVIDKYIEEKVASCHNIKHVNIDKIFNQDDFIEIVKPYGDAAVIPAICYWSTLKQAFVEYRDFESNYRGLYLAGVAHPKKYERHENRVRAVSELLLSLIPGGTLLRLGYQAVSGKEPEILKKLDSTVSEKLVDATDATYYLLASAGIGCIRVVENTLEYGGAALEFLADNKENAEKIMTLDISGDLKRKLDEVYGRDNWVRAISSSVERFGVTATYIGLTMLLPAGGIKAIFGGSALVLGKAGEKTKQDIGKTGELTTKEMAHGILCGAVMLVCAELGIAAVDKLGTSTPQIAREINKMLGGNVDPKLLKSITVAATRGLESGSMFAAYDVPEQVSKELERILDIDPEAKADWMQTLGGAGVAILTAATFAFVKELYLNRGFYSTYEERINRTPSENGEWTGDRGESRFVSDADEVAEYLKEAGVNGVDYKDGCPDFKPFSKGEVEIPSMSPDRHTLMGKAGNFEQADAALAQQRGNGCTARDVANWRKANGYTWHELNDMKTCQKVPASINKVYRHLGGVGECKRREDMMNEIIGRYTNKGGVFDE